MINKYGSGIKQQMINVFSPCQRSGNVRGTRGEEVQSSVCARGELSVSTEEIVYNRV